MKNKYRSDLSKAKNLGSAVSGTHHWWRQRFTAGLLVIMTFWAMSFFWQISNGDISFIIAKPYNSIMVLIFTVTMMYHAVLGVQVVIEDYVHCRIIRLIMIAGVQIFTIVTVVAFIVAVLYIIR